MMELLLKNGWTVTREKDGKIYPASVPGDITADLFKAGVIPDPYFGLNHRDVAWIPQEDFTYRVFFDVDESVFSMPVVNLEFLGVDLFSEVFVNGEKVGKTENMFRKFVFPIRHVLKRTGNELVVKMHSTIAKMQTFDTEGYFGTFNIPRLFIRKAQCHFGWDWAPEICGYGIWQDVKVVGEEKQKIDDLSYIANNDGSVTMFAELNYNIRATVDNYGVAIDGTKTEKIGDKLVFYLAKKPFSDDFVKIETDVTGKKNFVNFKIENPELWYPVGMGGQPLYPYKAELVRGGKVVSVKVGRMAFRTVELVTRPKDEKTLGYEFYINGQYTFIRGTNWVPAECFTGTIKDDKYRKLVSLAKDANMNMLRIWGGGIYEKDIFYDFCDELGMLVWQDFTFACSDLPEKDEAWLSNTLKECEYQIRRLRNHPSLIYWCGGNEKTGSYGLQISRGDFFVDCILQGLVQSLDKTRPYARQSPCSLTDVGNDLESGESHYNSFERGLEVGVEKYRDLVAERRVPFISECAVMGPNSIETNKKIYPENKLWPINEYWEDRLMDNPYAAVLMPFARRQEYYVERLYEKAVSLKDFTAKAMLVHAEVLRAESEFARSNKGYTGGFLNWMYTDIWPSGTWSVVDWYLEPKQAYYALKKAYAPVAVSFVKNGNGKTELFAVNDTLERVSLSVRYGHKKDGKTTAENTETVVLPENGLFKKEIGEYNDGFLFAEYSWENGKEKIFYSPTLWKGEKFGNDYKATLQVRDAHHAVIRVKANSFVKSLFLSFKDNYKYLFSDNYLDLDEGDEREIDVFTEDGDFEGFAFTDITGKE